MMLVKLYRKAECQLCEEALADLESLQVDFPHQLDVVDIATSEELQKKYGLEIPVVEVGPYTLKAPITRTQLQMTLGAARDRERHIEMVAAATSPEASLAAGPLTNSDRFSYWIAKHWLGAINLLVLFYLGLPFLAPVLMRAGATMPATLIYRAYGFMCHQLSYRSFFLFGEQVIYPRAAAGIEGVLTFNQATGLSEGNSGSEIFAAERYIGSSQIGYKVALCERDVAIYAGLLLFGLIYPLTGKRLPPLPWYLWLLFAIIPIGVDGLSQLISQPPIGLLPYRESTPLLRVLTGGLFGLCTAWFGYPMVEESMAETRKYLAAKYRLAGKSVAKA